MNAFLGKRYGVILFAVVAPAELSHEKAGLELHRFTDVALELEYSVSDELYDASL